MHRARRGSALVMASTLWISACGADPARQADSVDETSAGPVSVYAVNYPVQFFAERIGGDLVRIVRPSPSDGDPAFWAPPAEVVAEIQAADLILLNGAGYAGWVDKVSLPPSRLVDTSAAFADRLIPQQQGPTHSHGPEGEHSHDAVAFTTWLDPQQAAEQAEAVAGALVGLRPEQAGALREGLKALSDELAALDRRLSEWAEAVGDQPLLFSHPVYQYFERRYGLRGMSLHWEPDEAPDEEMWVELERRHGEHPARWMIWEAEPLPETMARLSEMGIESLVVSPAAVRPDEGDFLDRMRLNATELERMKNGVSP